MIFQASTYELLHQFFFAIKPMTPIPLHAQICKKQVQVPHARTEPP